MFSVANHVNRAGFTEDVVFSVFTSMNVISMCRHDRKKKSYSSQQSPFSSHPQDSLYIHKCEICQQLYV